MWIRGGDGRSGGEPAQTRGILGLFVDNSCRLGRLFFNSLLTQTAGREARGMHFVFIAGREA